MGIDRGTLDQLRHLLRPLSTRIANIVARGVVQLADDSKKLQLLQLGVLAGETVDGAEHHQPYGFSSVPLAGAEVVVVFPNGDRSHPLVVAASDRRYRPTGGQPGEVTVYNNTGAKITITKDGDIVATPAPGRAILAGSASASDQAAGKAALDKFMTVLGTVTDTAGACAALHTALQSAGWPASFVAGKIKIE